MLNFNMMLKVILILFKNAPIYSINKANTMLIFLYFEKAFSQLCKCIKNNKEKRKKNKQNADKE